MVELTTHALSFIMGRMSALHAQCQGTTFPLTQHCTALSVGAHPARSCMASAARGLGVSQLSLHPSRPLLCLQGAYDRIHVGASCPPDRVASLLQLLQPSGGLIVTPVSPNDLQCITLAANGAVTRKTLSQVRYSELEVGLCCTAFPWVCWAVHCMKQCMHCCSDVHCMQQHDMPCAWWACRLLLQDLCCFGVRCWSVHELVRCKDLPKQAWWFQTTLKLVRKVLLRSAARSAVAQCEICRYSVKGLAAARHNAASQRCSCILSMHISSVKHHFHGTASPQQYTERAGSAHLLHLHMLQEAVLPVLAALQVPSDTEIVLAQLRMERRARTSVPVPPSTFAEDVAGITGQPGWSAQAAHTCPPPLLHHDWHARVSQPIACRPRPPPCCFALASQARHRALACCCDQYSRPAALQSCLQQVCPKALCLTC